MHSAFQWAIENLNLLVAMAFLASLASLVFSAIQVKRKITEMKVNLERETARLLTVSDEIKRALLVREEQNVAETAQARQRVFDQPDSYKEILTPAGQQHEAEPKTRNRSDKSTQGVI